jgi:UDP-N-acetyl-D-mannosaminuronic acid dehydrogenase
MQEQRTINRVSVIGLGYIGLPTAAMFASRDLEVVGVDISQHVIDTINSGRAHIEEGALDELVAHCVSKGKLRASLKPEEADAFIIAVPTPVSHDERHAPDVSYVMEAARSIAPVLRKGCLVVLESTSPVGTTGAMARVLAELRPELTFPHQDAGNPDIHVAYCPERIIPGQMLRELVENDRIIGGMTQACTQRATGLYQAFVKGICHPSDDRSAEMVKLTENAFRDVNIAFANELSMICGDLDLDVWKIIEMANRHPRVSILRPGPGVGGHCIAVDPWFIVAESPERARLIETARQVNDAKPHYVIDQVAKLVDKKPSARIACLGLSYKPDVDDFRESPALEIAKQLHATYPGQVVCCDPYAVAMSSNDAKLELVSRMEQAVSNADVVVMLVGHQAFRSTSLPAGIAVVDSVGFWV